jgi:hypothetical protein
MKSIISILLIFNQLGLSINLHYCGGNFSSISIFNLSTNCEMHQSEHSGSLHHLSFTSEKFCSDEVLAINLNDFQLESIIELEFYKLNYPEKNRKSFISNFNFIKTEIYIPDPPPLNQIKQYLLGVQLLVYG